MLCSCAPAPTIDGMPAQVYVQILQAEDTRHWDALTLEPLLMDANPGIRTRAALAAGRIGDEAVIPRLAELLRSDSPEEVAIMAAFAIGEIESALGADVLFNTLKESRSKAVQAAAVEGLGKIAA